MNKIDKSISDLINKYISTLVYRYKLPMDYNEEAYNLGVLAYFKALETYDKRKSKDIEKWVGVNVYNALNSFFKKEKGTTALIKDLELKKETDGYNYSDTTCFAIISVLKQLTDMERYIYYSYLEGNSALSIAKDIGYTKKKVKNIIEFIDNKVKERITDVE